MNYWSRPLIENHLKSFYRQSTPSLWLCSSFLKQQIQLFESTFPSPQYRIFYALKAQNHPMVVDTLLNESPFSFEVSSRYELDSLLDTHHVSPSSILYSNPIRTTQDESYALSRGVRLFVCDRLSSIQHLQSYSLPLSIFLRYQYTGTPSSWPLDNKFGLSQDDILSFIPHIHPHSIHGISFHVGSQQKKLSAWEHTFQELIPFISSLRNHFNIPIRFLNIGGGIPVSEMSHPIDSSFLSSLAQLTKPLEPLFDSIFIEPGRALVAPIGLLHSKIIARSSRSDKDWIFLDVGRYNGLMETTSEHIHFPILTLKDSPPYTATCLAGPTCDGSDVLYTQPPYYLLPQSLSEGDDIFFLQTGAYSSSYSSYQFNGFPALQTYFIPEN